jgi:endonuclease-3
MFLLCAKLVRENKAMQLSLNFGQAPPLGADILHLRNRLMSAFGPFRSSLRDEPVAQLVKSLLSSRTHGGDAQATYERLKRRYPSWADLASASGGELRALLCPVTYADEKADWLSCGLKEIRRRTGALDLDFLAEWPVEAAQDWLKALDGVGPKVAGEVLNFSRLKRRCMVVDSHVHRVAKRYGLVSEVSEPEGAARTLMELAPDAWTAEDFYELHWLMKRLGQMRCTQSWARCGACPVAASCLRRSIPPRSNLAELHARPI